jgi:hypothetical protein
MAGHVPKPLILPVMPMAVNGVSLKGMKQMVLHL